MGWAHGYLRNARFRIFSLEADGIDLEKIDKELVHYIEFIIHGGNR